MLDELAARAETRPEVQRLAALQRMADRSAGVIQRGTDQDRQTHSANFLNGVAKLRLGRMAQAGNLRNDTRGKIRAIPAGAFVLYQGDLRDNFKIGLTSVEKDHVYGAVVTDAGRTLENNPASWPKGWITYENIAPDAAGSAAVQAPPAGASVTARALSALQGHAIAGKLPAPGANRRNLAPRAIRAWAEKSGNDLSARMPLADLGLAANDVNTPADHKYDTIDPTGELGLDRVDPGSQFFQNAQAFLALNAAAMPGTMAKDHELRSTTTGGARAREGQAWLGSYNKNLNAADIVAITGANVTNIFVNTRAPTWAAYEANLQHQHVAKGFQAASANWEPSATIRGQGNDALIDGMTKGSAGEYYLFHGTSKGNVANISRAGFDPEYVNYTKLKGYGKTGYGTAFTDQFAKALAYAPPEKIVAADHSVTYKHYVVVARVFAGRTHQVGDTARRTRGNLEMTQHNINYEEARGNKMKAQGQGMLHLGQTSSTVAASYTAGTPLHSTVQDRTFDLTLEKEGAEAADPQHQYRDTSLTVSDAIQMYPAYIIECTIPADKMRKGRRS